MTPEVQLPDQDLTLDESGKVVMSPLELYDQPESPLANQAKSSSFLRHVVLPKRVKTSDINLLGDIKNHAKVTSKSIVNVGLNSYSKSEIDTFSNNKRSQKIVG